MPGDYPPPKHRARYGNHPADTVNRWDAMAFCHWLGARLGYEVRLPTEFQWQLAATASAPKGTYPPGASHAGVLDMAGTIYEWCLNAFEDSDDTGWSTSQEKRRVLRGGSWGSLQVGARSAYRIRSNPDNRNYFIGFRVLCSSPIFDH